MTEQKQIINALYQSGIDTLVSAAYIMLGKKFLKFKSPDPGRYSLNDMGLITVSIAAADLTREYAVKKRLDSRESKHLRRRVLSYTHNNKYV